jgi:hypothetical protein
MRTAFKGFLPSEEGLNSVKRTLAADSDSDIMKLPADVMCCFCGEMAEWLKASVSKTDILSNRYRGFESRSLRTTPSTRTCFGAPLGYKGRRGDEVTKLFLDACSECKIFYKL